MSRISSFTPNVALFLERFAIGGFTFGEAAWAAQPALSWQTTVIGDPLYRPFGKPPMGLHQELSRTPKPAHRMVFPATRECGSIRGVSDAYLANLIETTGVSTNSAVLTEKLADLYAMQGKPSSAIDAYERALTLNPSPEQRIRIRLTLADKLLAQDFAAAARRDIRNCSKSRRTTPAGPPSGKK